MAASIYDVAKRAGVSISTVSRILNGSAAVSDKKAQAVREAVEFFQYEPNQFARGLVKKTSNLIGVYFPDGQLSIFDNSYHLELMKGIEQVLSYQNYSMVLLGETKEYSRRKKQIPKYLEFVKQKRLDGLILSGLDGRHIETEVFQQLMDEDTPIVYIGKRIHEQGYNIYAQFEQYHVSMIGKLRENGHRNILLYMDRSQSYRLKSIMEQVRQEMPEILLYPVLIESETGDRMREQLRISVEQYIAGMQCTAIVSPTMENTQLLLSVCAELSISVPQQVSLISVEHRPNAGHLVYPRISAFYVPARDMGSGAAELLMQAIQGTEPDEETIEYESVYIERDSIRRL